MREREAKNNRHFDNPIMAEGRAGAGVRMLAAPLSSDTWLESGMGNWRDVSRDRAGAGRLSVLFSWHAKSGVLPLTRSEFLKSFYLFIFRERGREGEREGEKHQCVVASHVALTRELVRNPLVPSLHSIR